MIPKATPIWNMISRSWFQWNPWSTSLKYFERIVSQRHPDDLTSTKEERSEEHPDMTWTWQGDVFSLFHNPTKFYLWILSWHVKWSTIEPKPSVSRGMNNVKFFYVLSTWQVAWWRRHEVYSFGEGGGRGSWSSVDSGSPSSCIKAVVSDTVISQFNH